MAGAGDSEGTFGGNGSVFWKIETQNGKDGTVQQTDHGNGHHTQQGHNGTPPGGRFTITLKRPGGSVEPAKLAQSLRDAADGIDNGDNNVDIDLVIEPRTHKQITVNWPSAPETFTPSMVGV